MKVHLNRDTLNKDFKVKDDFNQKVRITHTSGAKGKKLLPYTASDNSINNYRALLGNFSRNLSFKKYKAFDKPLFFETIGKNVESKELDRFLTIINELFFDDQGELVLSHPLFFNYLEDAQNNEKKVAQFLKDVLATPEVIEKVSNLYNQQPDNVLLSLLYSSLPLLEQRDKKEDAEFYGILPVVQELFKEDLLFLLNDNELLINHFQDLVLYYYLFYTTQLILNLDRMFSDQEDKIVPVFFNVSWENRSKTRDSYKQGWKMVSAKLPKLFAHINCLAMLNYVENDKYTTITYDRFKELVSSLPYEDQYELASGISQLNEDYQSYLVDVDWSKMKWMGSSEEQIVLKSVEELFHSISFQFQKKISARSRAAERYYEGYLEFVKKYFLKQSGSLGYTFNLSQDQVIFLTKICIKNNKKMPLRELFNKMEDRGVYFDRDSKRHVTELFERLNILEKKSDSGDAQYVKFIL
ncbi:DNA phosphorothioation-dependent restriction protein DptG [Niallia taxi]|uniref:DNA phosphorothioation-dependent restriction protein DptG n=1 Tax=Niallia taxi TaxID=2499688 RepID=UPI002E1E4C8E|nr:DNA phosphorothioation-dependent restriction protein DptG [Niallia taxi]MED4057778.1 DNA phosphorothioation-dependent restriction protein DptG [Niallia taxi]MED4122335.1 DNA phosphorothioation-dependent restriction protein DptG [Niallia taxi]